MPLVSTVVPFVENEIGEAAENGLAEATLVEDVALKSNVLLYLKEPPVNIGCLVEELSTSGVAVWNKATSCFNP